MAPATEGSRRESLDDALTLEVPGNAAQLSTARLFAAAVGRLFGLDESAIDDLKLGVSEAVTTAVDDPARMGSPTIVVRPGEDGALRFEVVWRRASGGDLEASMSLHVVRGLFSTAALTVDPDGAARIRFAIAHADASGPEGADET